MAALAIVPHHALFESISLAFEEIHQPNAMLAVAGEVNVGKNPPPEPFHPLVKVCPLWEMKVDGNRPHHAQDKPPCLRFVGQRSGLVQEDLRFGILVEGDFLR